MILDKVLIFLLFLCPLVFFHELGHYLFAKLFKVRVETFSIGFGPKLFSFNKFGTEFTFSLFPLGGYVKMYGDDLGARDSIPKEERPFAFNQKGKWARFWIVFGGPLANFILAFVLFSFLTFKGEMMPEVKLGFLPQDSKLKEMGFLAGDILQSINGLPLDEVSLEDGSEEGDGEESTLLQEISILRQGSKVSLSLTSFSLELKEFFHLFMSHPARMRRPILVDTRGNLYFVTPTAKKIDFEVSLEELSSMKQQDFFLYRFSWKNTAVEGKGVRPFDDSSIAFDYSSEKKLNIKKGEFLNDVLLREQFYPYDLVVQSIVEESPAAKALLRAGDLIVSLNGQRVSSFEDLRSFLQKTEDYSTVKIGYYRFAERKEISLIPAITEQAGEKMKTIGVYSSLQLVPTRFIKAKGKSFFESIQSGFFKVGDISLKMLEGFKKLFTSEASLKTIGGPLAIGKVAVDTFTLGFDHFLRLMAMISINLGVINLFPIPVLDGGHIVFIILEVLNRGPLSQKKMERAQQFGATLLFILIFLAIFNDVGRFILN